jgi:hypothetical protein
MTTEPRLVADDAADLAVLDMALAERDGALAPPDLWPALERRSLTVDAALPTGRTRGAWLAAALLLLALGAFAAWAVSGGDEPRDEVTRRRDADEPRSLQELQQRLATAEVAHASACGAWDDDVRRWVALPRHELDTFLRFGLRPALDRDDLTAAVTAVAAAAVVDGARIADVVWSHELVVQCGARACTLLVQTGGRGAARLAFRSPNGAVELTTRGFPFADLGEQLDALTAKTIADLGFVVGAHGFDAVPIGTASLRPLGPPAGSVSRLARFPKLTRLDLAHAPEWQRADVLRALPRQLRQLSCPPRALTPDAFAAIGAMGGLQELFLVGGDPLAVVLGAVPPHDAPALDDGALRALGELRALQELALAGGQFGDDGLASLGNLPALSQLWIHGGRITDAGLRHLVRCPLRHLGIAGCAGVRGTTLRELPALRVVSLDGDALHPDVLAHAAALPQLDQLSLRTRTAVRLDALPRFPALRELILDGPLDRAAIVFLERCPALQKLALRAEPPLRDDELVLLHGMRRLRSLKLESPLVTPAGRDALRAALPDCTIGSELR